MTPWDLAKSGTEAGEQRALFAWANMAERYGIRVANDPLAYQGLQADLGNGIPQLHWLHAIHNQGHGDAVRGARAKAEGLKAGVADIFLPVAMCAPQKLDWYHGLYIEMKKLKGGVASDAQKEFAKYCLNQGYAHRFCKGWIEARDAICDYLGLV